MAAGAHRSAHKRNHYMHPRTTVTPMTTDHLEYLRRNIAALQRELSEARETVAMLEQDLADDQWELERLEAGIDG